MGVDNNLNKSADQSFKIKTYFVIVDSFINVLNYRFDDCSNTVKQFECLDPKKYFFEKKSPIQNPLVNLKHCLTFIKLILIKMILSQNMNHFFMYIYNIN